VQTFDTELLRTLVAVAESGGFTHAARTLHSTQSTVSAQIQRLEEVAGCPLFIRSTRTVRLTSAGETLLGYARTILRLNEDARLRLSGTRHAGRVRIGANEDLTDSWLPAVLHRFSSQHPEIEVELEIGIGPRLFEMVVTQELDLAVGSSCEGRSEGRRLWSDSLVWAFSEGVDVPDELPLAFFPEPCPYREAAIRALAVSQRRWRIASTSSSLAGVRVTAMAGLAITPLPLQTMRPGLRILGPKNKMPRLPEIEYVLKTRASDARPAVSALGNLVQEMAAKRQKNLTQRRKGAKVETELHRRKTE
jgi:DNA-binding transcriptional LysR family regulator